MLTKKELVLEALRFNEPVTVPYTHYLAGELAEQFGEEEFAQLQGENHTVRILWELCDESHDGYFLDRFGVRWNISANGDAMYQGDFLSEPKASDIPEVELITDQDIADISAIQEANSERFVYFQFTCTLNGRLATFRGMDGYLADLALNPVFIEEAMEKLTAMHMPAIEKLLTLPIDSIVFGDDFGGQNGMLMSPGMYRQFFKPFYAQISEKIRAGGKIVGLHSCGDVTEIMGDLVDIGIQFFHPLQPECMDIAKMKQEYGRELAFRGGIGVQDAVTFGTPEQVRRAVSDAAATLSKGGGYLMETVKYVGANVPIDNVKALVDELQRAARYEF